jgi:hypothetical protein
MLTVAQQALLKYRILVTLVPDANKQIPSEVVSHVKASANRSGNSQTRRNVTDRSV